MVSEVYALGGSVIEKNLSNLEEIDAALEKDEQILVVTGAGHLKKHQEAIRGKVSKARVDRVGIEATRLNAKTLLTLMEDAYPGVPETVQEAEEVAVTGRDIVMGGLNPGFSTDAVAAVLAETFDADLYIVTDVEGIYTGDPEEDPNAERLEKITTSRLLEMTSGKNEPGVYSVVDRTAVEIIKRSGIETKLFEGTLENLENPGDAEGTRITKK